MVGYLRWLPCSECLLVTFAGRPQNSPCSPHSLKRMLRVERRDDIFREILYADVVNSKFLMYITTNIYCRKIKRVEDRSCGITSITFYVFYIAHYADQIGYRNLWHHCILAELSKHLAHCSILALFVLQSKGRENLLANQWSSSTLDRLLLLVLEPASPLLSACKQGYICLNSPSQMRKWDYAECPWGDW